MLEKLVLDESNLKIMSKEYWRYCDAIITPSGDYYLAIYGHVNTMIELTGLDSDFIYNLMPISAAPLFWLVQYTNSLVVNFDRSIASPDITKEQKLVYNKLVKNKIIKDNLSILKRGQV